MEAKSSLACWGVMMVSGFLAGAACFCGGAAGSGEDCARAGVAGRAQRVNRARTAAMRDGKERFMREDPEKLGWNGLRGQVWRVKRSV